MTTAPNAGGGWAVKGILKLIGLIAAGAAGGYMFSGADNGVRIGDTNNSNQISIKPSTNEAADRTVYLPALGGDKYLATTSTDVGALGTMATQNASAVAITGGSITGITDLAVADGGTGASDASTARTNLAAAGTGTTNTFTADQTMTGGANALTIGTPTADANAGQINEASAATETPLVLEGATNQTADVFKVKNQGGTVVYSIMPGGAPNPEIVSWRLDQFVEDDTVAASRYSLLGLDHQSTGAGADDSVVNGALGGRLGYIKLDTGTSGAGGARLYRGSDTQYEFGTVSLTWCGAIRVSALSDGIDTYTVRTGFNEGSLATSVDGCFFRYTHGTNSGKFECVTRSNSVETAADSGITVAADTWYDLRVEVNAAGTSVAFYIDGAKVQTNTTNIPTGSSRMCSIVAKIEASAGTTSRSMFVDYFAVKIGP